MPRCLEPVDRGASAEPSTVTADGLQLVLPPAALAPYVAGYWHERNTEDCLHRQPPDGCVDIVIHRDRTGAHVDVWGTSTKTTLAGIQPGADYFGIRLQPGQARHLLRVSASELTDTRLHWAEAASVPLPQHLHAVGVQDWAQHGTAWLHAHLQRQPPVVSPIDAAIATIRSDPAQPPAVTTLAGIACLGRRQFERRFRQQVGVSPHRFIAIARFQKACRLLRRHDHSIARVAQACGYADHSHLVRAFDDMAAMPPSRWRRDVANIQDRAN